MPDKQRILVIDDDAITRLLVREVLETNDFETIDAENGQQGLDLIARMKPDLVLLDVMMPQMDGFEFLTILGSERPITIPIIMMTAVEDIDCVEHALSLGAADFISKPIQWLLLPYRIRYVLRQHRAEETLRVANEEQRAIFNAATSGIVLIKNHIILRCNRKLEQIFGYAEGELDNQSIRMCYPDDTAFEVAGNAITEGKFHRREQQLIRKDGQLFWARFSGQLLDMNDPSIGVVGIIDDISVEHEAAQALLRAKEIAEAATKMKSDFLANMSHEIRTPMNGVLGMLDLLRETDLNATQQDWTETAYNSAEALLDIINDILDFSKLEAGKFEVEQRDFNLVDLVYDICALMAGRAHANGLELNCSIPSPMPICWCGDPMRIRQVLTNLIGNAVKFTLHGEVSVIVTRTVLTDDRDELRFEVKDTGIGISQETQLQLFKPFTQADSATSRRFGGSGLGLSITKKLVELMGGSLGMSSELGKGSCFWFSLPLKQSLNNIALAQKLDVSGKRVLVADDNATNRNILLQYLLGWGMEVSMVENGSSALTTLLSSAISGINCDLLLLDMQMPGMDGLTVAKCLAKVPSLAKIPIIMLSSRDQAALSDFQGTGVKMLLTKPVRQLQLFDAISSVLQDSVATEKSTEPEVELPRYPDKKVLVVEDNRINQKVILSKLAKFAINPELAENGQIALDKMTKNHYDLVLMDCQMPIMDGYTATVNLRRLEASQGLPRQTVVALTANALEGEREKCLAAGMDDYLTKPIISTQLIAMLASRLGTETGSAQTLAVVKPPVPALGNKLIWDESATLKHLEGDKLLLAELQLMFLQEAPKQLSDLGTFLAQGKLGELANSAHALKGSTGHFYAEAAKEAVSVLEQAARNGEPADYPTLVAQATLAVTTLMAALTESTKPQAPN